MGDCLQANESRIYYERQGEGLAVIFLHDGLAHSDVWDAQLAPFSEEHTFIRYDRRGYGRSDSATGPFSNETDLLRLMDVNGVDRAVLVGSSSGGGIAVNFALLYPARVIALVLVGAVVDGLGFSEHFIQRNAANSGRDIDETIEKWIDDPWIIAPQNTMAKARLRELLKGDVGDLGSQRCEAAPPHDDSILENALGRLREIRVPTLIITGAADIPDVHAHAGALESGIQDAQRVVLSGVGHLSYLEDPDLFNRVVLSFLSSLK